jgi:hypothetical protein
MVWDDLGMVAYDDRPEGIMSHLYLALDPSVTPEQPLHASKVVVDVNGSSLTADTTERRLPSGGEGDTSLRQLHTFSALRSTGV